MLQSPLSRKSGQRSERNTPTPQNLESPNLHTVHNRVAHELLNQQNLISYKEAHAVHANSSATASSIEYHTNQIVLPSRETSKS